MSFTQDATRLAAGFSDSYIKVWSLNGERLRSLKGSTELSASDFEHASDWGRGREPIGDLCKKLVGHSGPVYGTSFSPDNKYLVSGSEDGTARLWSMDTYSNVVVYKVG